MDIVAAYQLVGSYRGAAEICATTHKTVKRVIERTATTAAGEHRPVRAPRPSNYEVVRLLVADAVTAGKGRVSAKRLLPRARAAGYAGSDRNFRRLVAQERRRYRRVNGHARRPAVWAPGEHLVIDWGVIAGVHVFCAVLAWSRVRFVRFAADEKQDTTLRLLAECFEVLGGVPAVVLTDRMGCLKGGVVANRVVPTPDLVRFATHYRFRPDFCEAHDPESKGLVENLVGYGTDDLLRPLMLDHALHEDASINTAIPSNRARLDAVEQLAAVADQAGLTLIQLALGFVTTHRAVTSAIIGPRTTEHLHSQPAAAAPSCRPTCSTQSTRSLRPASTSPHPRRTTPRPPCSTRHCGAADLWLRRHGPRGKMGQLRHDDEGA